MIAAFFRAVNRAKTVPPSPFRGDWGRFFAQISGVIFCGKCCVWGIIGGVYIQAIKIPDRAHKTLRRAAGHDRRQNGGGQEPGQDGRQISGRRRRQIGRGWHGVSRNRGRQVVAVVAAAYAGAGGGAHLCRPRGSASRQQAEGQQEQQPGAASRETGQQPTHQAGAAHHQREQNRQPRPAPTPAARPKITPNAPAPSPARAKSERPRPRKVLLGRRPSLAGSEAQNFFR